MIDQRTYQLLQDVIRRQGRSLLQYSDESFPWSTAGDGALMGQLRDMTLEERDAAAALSRYLVKHRLAPPYLGAYPSYFTSYNYMSLDKLLPLLLQHQKRCVTQIIADHKSLQDTDARTQVAAIVEMNRRHLQTLQGLVGV